MIIINTTTIIIIIIFAALCPFVATLTSSPTVLNRLLEVGKVNAIIGLAPLELTLQQSTREQVYHELIRHSQFSQQSLVTLLADLNVDYESFWIDNSLLISAMNVSVYERLLTKVTDISGHILLDGHIASIDHADVKIIEIGPDRLPYHTNQLNLPTAWSKTTGAKDIVIASIDTGVQFDHPVLVSSYRGYEGHGQFNHTFSWMDMKSAPQSYEHPHDPHGHGTHTMGSIVGMEGIGAAPTISWITMRACDAHGCLRSDLAAAAQFAMCPGGACHLGAHIVSNSWGATDPSAMSWFERVASVWRAAGMLAVFAAGMLAVFAAGNSGPSCDTIYSPASSHMVLSVGAVNANNKICTFSSRSNQDMESKPDVVAPGFGIISAFPGNKFAEMSGTSMACPLVAGIAGLVLSVNPSITPINIIELIKETANNTVIQADKCCEDGRCAYGAGMVNAGNAVWRAS